MATHRNISSWKLQILRWISQKSMAIQTSICYWQLQIQTSICYWQLQILAWIRERTTFFRLHLAYFILLSFAGSLVLWLSPKHPSSQPLSFVDALFNAVSAVTVTGLVSVEMHRFSVLDLITLLFLMVFGSQVFTSLIPLFVRRSSRFHPPYATVDPRSSPKELETRPSQKTRLLKISSMPPLTTKFSDETEPAECDYSFLSSSGLHFASKQEQALSTGGQRSLECESAIDMSVDIEKDRRKLEREALITLSWIVAIYFVFAQMGGFMVCAFYFLGSPDAARVLKKKQVNQVFFSMFSSVSAFANAGFSLLDENLVPLQKSAVVLICLSVLILIGNTMFAPCLRVIIWLLYRCARGKKKSIYKYLLQNPRRCYTHLFPHSQTLWLAFTVLVFNAAQMICIYGFDWNSTAFDGLGTGYKFVDGMFQSIVTRNAGMNVVNLAALSAPTLFLSAGMMYVAAYPVYVTRQHSREPVEQQEDSNKQLERDIYMQSRKLLARDSVYLLIAIFLICVIERSRIEKDPINFSVFNLIFEVISCYGNVGLSIGYSCSLRLYDGTPCQDVPYSFSGKWTPMGKVVAVIVMFLGRHRGLPDNLDWAIKLPTPSLRPPLLPSPLPR